MERLGATNSEARKRLSGEPEALRFTAMTPEPILVFEPKAPGSTIGDARKRIMEGGAK